MLSRSQFKNDEAYAKAICKFYGIKEPSPQMHSALNMAYGSYTRTKDVGVIKPAKDYDSKEDFIVNLVSLFNDKRYDESTREFAKVLVFSDIDKLIYHVLQQNYPTYCDLTTHKELVEEMYLRSVEEIMPNIDKFDGTYAFSTFARRHILHSGQDQISKTSGKTTHCSKLVYKANKAREEIAEETNRAPETISDAEIAERAGISPVQVKHAREMDISVCSMEATGGVAESEFYDSPEDEIIKREKSEWVQDAIAQLPEGHQLIVKLKMDGYSTTQIKDEFADDLKILGLRATKNNIDAIYSAAKSNLATLLNNSNDELSLHFQAQLSKAIDSHDINFELNPKNQSIDSDLDLLFDIEPALT